MHALEIRDLKKQYANGFEALKGISLEVEQGDFYALLGPNGAGKSTTIGIITSLVTKSSGTVKIFGYDLDTQLAQAKSQIGLVPQDFNFNIFETVLQIVVKQAGFYGVPKKEALVRAERYLNQLSLWDKRFEQAKNLSGGMKRRLMIARALMHQPKLLILDEPTAGVDIEVRRTMWAYLKKINEEQGITIILTTHYLEEAEMLCRHIGIINKGQVIENTSMKTLLANLNVETFVLDLMPDSQVPILSSVLSQHLDKDSLEIQLSKQSSLNEVFSELTEANVKVLSMRNKENRLERLFVNIIDGVGGQ